MEPKTYQWEPATPPDATPETDAVAAPDATAAPTGPVAYGYEPPTQKDVSFLSDLGQSAYSGLLTAGATMRGIPGSLMYYGDRAGNYVLGRPQPDASGIAPHDFDILGNLDREQRQAVRAGEAVPFIVRSAVNTDRPFREGDPTKVEYATTWPTITGSIREAEQNWPGMKYDPNTYIGSLVKTGTDFAVQSVPLGGPRTVVQRVLTGFGSGVGSEAVGDIGALGGPVGETTGRFLGAVAGDIATRKFGTFFQNIAMTDAVAARQLSEAAAKDFADNPELRQKLQNALDSGETIIPYDFLQGPNAQAILKKNFNPDQVAFIENFNKNLTARSAGVNNELDQFFSQNFGGSLRDETFASDLKAANNAERTKIYTEMRALPHAQNLWTPELRSALDNGLVAEAAGMVSGMVKAKEFPTAWNVRAPDITPPIPGVKQQFIFNPKAPPNIQYWDQVQRKLRALADAAERSSDPSMAGKAEAYREARQQLLDAIEAPNAVPEFGSVRNRAAELFGEESSLEGGFKMAQKLGSNSPFKVDEFMSNFDKLSKEQQQQFAQGAARFVFGKTVNGVSNAVSYLENPNVRDVLSRVMGPEKFDALYGKTIAAALKQDATALSVAASSGGKKVSAHDALMYLATTGGFGAVGALPAAFSSPNMSAILGTTFAAAGFTGKLALSASEAKVAREALTLAMSQKPEDAVKLGKLINENYDVASALMKQSDFLRSATGAIYNAGLNATAEAAPLPPEPLAIPLAQNQGGRVERKAGGRVANSISAEVVRTRALLGNKTASMLSVPDDAIISALNLARKT